MQNSSLNECEKALEKIDLLYLFSRYGQFNWIDGDLIGRCPYHKGHFSSLVVKPKSQDFHCVYSKCNQRGSIIQLVAAFRKSGY